MPLILAPTLPPRSPALALQATTGVAANLSNLCPYLNLWTLLITAVKTEPSLIPPSRERRPTPEGDETAKLNGIEPQAWLAGARPERAMIFRFRELDLCVVSNLHSNATELSTSAGI